MVTALHGATHRRPTQCRSDPTCARTRADTIVRTRVALRPIAHQLPGRAAAAGAGQRGQSDADSVAQIVAGWCKIDTGSGQSALAAAVKASRYGHGLAGHVQRMSRTTHRSCIRIYAVATGTAATRARFGARGPARGRPIAAVLPACSVWPYILQAVHYEGCAVRDRVGTSTPPAMTPGHAATAGGSRVCPVKKCGRLIEEAQWIDDEARPVDRPSPPGHPLPVPVPPGAIRFACADGNRRDSCARNIACTLRRCRRIYVAPSTKRPPSRTSRRCTPVWSCNWRSPAAPRTRISDRLTGFAPPSSQNWDTLGAAYMKLQGQAHDLRRRVDALTRYAASLHRTSRRRVHSPPMDRGSRHREVAHLTGENAALKRQIEASTCQNQQSTPRLGQPTQLRCVHCGGSSRSRPIHGTAHGICSIGYRVQTPMALTRTNPVPASPSAPWSARMPTSSTPFPQQLHSVRHRGQAR